MDFLRGYGGYADNVGLQLVTSGYGYGWLWFVLGGYRWIWVTWVMGGYLWLRMVVGIHAKSGRYLRYISAIFFGFSAKF